MNALCHHAAAHRFLSCVVLSGAVLTACANPAQPTGTFPLSPGAYVLAASAVSLDFSGGTDCRGTGTFVGVSHLSYVTLSQEASTWIVRSESAEYGTAEFRFAAATGSSGSFQLNGTARGVSHDLRASSTLGVATMAFVGSDGTSPATLSGVTNLFPTVQLAGSVQGSIAVHYGSLGSGSCASAFWAVRKAEGCEVNRTCR